jgi:phosphate ABC transporter phosphate-binding protein
MIALAGCLAARPACALDGTAARVTRLYVEAFAAKAGTEKLRDDVAADLRKLPSVAVVPDESQADLIVGGGGEIWIRGYRSFSPRSHMKLPTNGTPIYGGYLSVELRNRRGVTVWSSLVTPGADSADVSKELAHHIAKQLAEALPHVEEPSPATAVPRTAVDLKAAGATFPYPVYTKWLTNYQTENPGIHISYEAVGSEAGIRSLLAGQVDFAASDNPEAIRQLAPKAENVYLLFPSVVGAVVPIVNLPGVPDQMALTPEALTGIYLGTITKWNDPVLAHANPHVHLPDLDIVVVHRADGSGTSYAWSSYLSQVSPAWSAQVGASFDPKWPTGRAATGNEGVAKTVKELGGSIGYVEFIYALQNHLSYASVRNRNGEFVEASLESIAAAVDGAEIPDNFKVSIVDAPGHGAYPIATFTWLVVPARIGDAQKRGAVSDFLRWMLGPGQRQAAALGYLPLPKELAAREVDAISRIQ